MRFANVQHDIHKCGMLESLANDLIERFDFRKPDEIDVEKMCYYYKIKIKPSPDPDITNSFLTGKRKGIIYMEQTHDYRKYRELLCEEFAHLYLHDISQTSLHPVIVAKQERQAKNLSAYLYMPLSMMDEIVIARDQPVDISTLADEFMVTEEFAYYRLSLIFPGKVDAIARANGRFGYIRWLE